MNEKKITESARGEMCCVRLPGVCNYNPETTVFAHLNGVRFGHGIGQKTKWGAYCCSSCHDEVDRRTRILDGDFAKIAHLEGTIETLNKLVEKGLL